MTVKKIYLIKRGPQKGGIILYFWGSLASKKFENLFFFWLRLLLGTVLQSLQPIYIHDSLWSIVAFAICFKWHKVDLHQWHQRDGWEWPSMVVALFNPKTIEMALKLLHTDVSDCFGVSFIAALCVRSFEVTTYRWNFQQNMENTFVWRYVHGCGLV